MDRTQYLFDGRLHGKNRLVLAVVQKYVFDHPGISAEKLMMVFDRSLQNPGTLGVVRILDDVKRSCSDYERRFFIKSGEVIKTSSKDCVVCTQWAAHYNIEKFLDKAKSLGYDIIPRP
ncbi:MAG: hypothetical protein LBR29_08235 [Methylobacteriaceae bacterium]|jgi:hypothetical protein|nr:hypothetical protein [Methylobacteriaceae bacterium]